MQLKKILPIIVLVVLIISLSAAVFFFRSDIQSLLGVQSGSLMSSKDIRGETITFNAGGRIVSIPPRFSEETLSFIKQEMTENGGLPLRIERKGNPLPFGIP